MPIRTSNNTGNFSLPPEGMHVARCYRVIDCGTHRDQRYGKEKRIGWIFWELPATNRASGDPGTEREPHTIGKRYNLSHNEKSILRIDLESWYGKRFDTKQLDDAGGFDLEKLIGRPALLNIVYSDDGQYANVMSVNPLPDGMNCPDAINTPFVFTLEPYDAVKFSDLSERMQEYIRGSTEWQAINNGHGKRGNGGDGIVPGNTPTDTDVPFGPSKGAAPPAAKPAGKFDDMADDIPF